MKSLLTRMMLPVMLVAVAGGGIFGAGKYFQWSFQQYLVAGSFGVFAIVVFLLLRLVRSLKKGGSSRGAQPAAKDLHQSDDGAISQLNKKFEQALATWKQSPTSKRDGGKAAAPWYLVVGPAESGKTSLLLRSGLEFLHREDRGHTATITQNCDFFFSTEGTFLDTAGRYFSDAEAIDEWRALLENLRKHRRKLDLSGIILNISITDILDNDETQLEAMINGMRERIREILSRFRTKFPVYIVFTKCDLINGFAEYFEHLDRPGRQKIWGTTVDLVDVLGPPENAGKQHRQTDLGKIFAKEFRVLCEAHTEFRQRRLRDLAIESEQTMSHPHLTTMTYAFPIEFMQAGEKLAEFVRKLFKNTSYHETPVVRGFYFTSSLQEGLPIDRFLQSVRSEVNINGTGNPYFGSEPAQQSYFIGELFSKIVIPDRNIAENISGSTQRDKIVNWVLLGSAALLALLITVLSLSGYNASKSEINNIALLGSRVNAMNWDGSIDHARFKLLDDLRMAAADLSQTGSHFGLGRQETLVAESAELLRRKFRTIILQHAVPMLAKKLRSASSLDDQVVHDYFRMYQLMSNETTRLEQPEERRFLVRRLRQFLEQEVLPASSALPRESHVAILRLSEFFAETLPAGRPIVTADDRLLDLVRSAIYQEPNLGTIYTRLRNQGIDKLGMISLEKLVGFRAMTVFESNPEIPVIFTKAGWKDYIEPQFLQTVEDPGQADWVTGFQPEKLASKLGNKEEMQKELQKRYYDEYIKQWESFLKTIRYQRPGSINLAATQLYGLSSVQDSPLQNLLQRFKDETTFRSGPELLDQATSHFAGESDYPVDNYFSRWHHLLSATAGPPILETVLSGYNGLAADLENLVDDEAAVLSLVANVVGGSSGSPRQAMELVKSQLPLLDPDIRTSLFEEPVSMAWSLVLQRAQTILNRQFEEDVEQFYRRYLGRYFPFDNNGEPVETEKLYEFINLDNGRFFKFVQEDLDPYIDNRRRPRRWEGRGIVLGPRFQAAMEKTENLAGLLINRGSIEIQYTLRPKLPEPQGVLHQVCLSIDGIGEGDCFQFGSPTTTDYMWPANSGRYGARLEIRSLSGKTGIIEHDNEWGWLQLFRDAVFTRLSNRSQNVAWKFNIDRTNITVHYELSARESIIRLIRDSANVFNIDCPSQINQ